MTAFSGSTGLLLRLGKPDAGRFAATFSADSSAVIVGFAEADFLAAVFFAALFLATTGFAVTFVTAVFFAADFVIGAAFAEAGFVVGNFSTAARVFFATVFFATTLTASIFANVLTATGLIITFLAATFLAATLTAALVGGLAEICLAAGIFFAVDFEGALVAWLTDSSRVTLGSSIPKLRGYVSACANVWLQFKTMWQFAAAIDLATIPKTCLSLPVNVPII